MSTSTQRSGGRKNPTQHLEDIQRKLGSIMSGGDGYGDPCESAWRLLGRTIQVGKDVAADEAGERGEGGKWSVRDFETTIMSVFDNIHLAFRTLDARECESGSDIWKVKNALPETVDEMYRPIDAYNTLSDVGQAYVDVIPIHLSRDEGLVSGLKIQDDNQDGGRSEGSGMEYDMRCAVGESLRDVQREMVEHFADGAPESLTVDWNDDRKEYYACAIVSDIAEDY